MQDTGPAQPEWVGWLMVLRRRWILVAAGLALGVALSLVALQLLTPKYDAYLQLVPVERTGATISRNLSGLASLAGININNAPISQFHLALEAMTGRDVAEVVAADTALMVRMFPDEWDPVAGRWQQPPDALEPLKSLVKRLLGMPVRQWTRPGAVEVQEFIFRRYAVAENKQRGVATLTFRDKDPQLAQDLLTKIYFAADTHLRQRIDVRTEAYIAYLQRKLQEVALAEHRQVLAEAMADQERTLMMARSGQPFASEPLGTVAVTDRPTSPSIPLVLAIGVLVGGAAGVAAAFLIDRRTPRSA